MKNEEAIKAPYIPTGSLETYISMYRGLYKKYRIKATTEKEQSKGGKRLSQGHKISSDSHFEYYVIEHGWREIRKMLDRPIIESAICSVGDKIRFIKRSFIPKGTPIGKSNELESKYVECEGIVDKIRTSDDGSGEVVYDIGMITPECREGNPYAMEKDIIH